MYETETVEAVKNRILSRLETDLDTREGSQTNDEISGIAEEICETYHALDALLPAFYVDEGSGPYIDKQAALMGIYRKPGAQATCQLTVQGTVGAKIPERTPFYTKSGLEYLLVQDLIVSESDTAVGTLVAERPGTAYNIGAGEIASTLKNHPGIIGYRNEAASGGLNPETDEALLARYHARLRQPATSGNVYHYQAWAMEADGVGAARVFAKHAGPGTVRVVLLDGDMTPAQPEAVKAARSIIEVSRPIGPTVTVEAAVPLQVAVTAVCTVDGSTTKSAVGKTFRTVLTDYLRQLTAEAFADHIDCDLEEPGEKGYTILYNRVAFLLLSIPGVVDYTSLTINQGTLSLSVAADQAPVLGEVSVT